MLFKQNLFFFIALLTPEKREQFMKDLAKNMANLDPATQQKLMQQLMNDPILKKEFLKQAEKDPKLKGILIKKNISNEFS